VRGGVERLLGAYVWLVYGFLYTPILLMGLFSLNAGDTPVVAGESAVAGLAGAIAATQVPAFRDALGLGPESRILVFSTEGDTDPGLYARIVGRSADEVRAGASP
jgi:diaminopropionate ammonia-lyase